MSDTVQPCQVSSENRIYANNSNNKVQFMDEIVG